MSREELIEEIISNTQRLEEMGTDRKDMEKAIKNGQFDLSEFKPQLQELFKIKDERIAKLRCGIETMGK